MRHVNGRRSKRRMPFRWCLGSMENDVFLMHGNCEHIHSCLKNRYDLKLCNGNNQFYLWMFGNHQISFIFEAGKFW